MTKPKGRYIVSYPVQVFAYIEFPEPIDAEAEGFDLSNPEDVATLERRREEEVPTVYKVVVDDENIGEPTAVEYDNADTVTDEEEKRLVLEAVDGPDADWPGWEFGF